VNWNVSPKEAILLQKELARKIICEDDFEGPIKTVAGVDLGYVQGKGHAVVVVLDFQSLELIEVAEATLPVNFPYIPGLLSFRETPVAMEAFKKLQNKPDLIFCDGQGIAHPRRFGVACHIGLLTEKPTIGVAKSILVGSFENLGTKRGEFAALIHKGEQIGVALRTKDDVQPVYVSVGHKISLKTAIELTLKCSVKTKLPEPIRLADRFASFRDKKSPT
jgi:deoxyribonuclease V